MLTNADLAAQVSAFVDQQRLFIDQWRAQVIGAADAGPNGDGLFPITDPYTGFEHPVPSPARMAIDAKALSIGTLFGAGPHAIGANYAGRLIGFSHNTTITAVLQRNSPVGTVVGGFQMNTGKIRYVPQSGAVIRNRQQFNATAGQWAEGWGKVISNSSGNNAEWLLSGDLQFL
jgi:hypothetical protein